MAEIETKRAPVPLAPLTILCFALLLLLTAATALLWSHAKLFWTDELLEFYSDSKPSILRIIVDQYRAPFSLEPPLFHILLHTLEKLIHRDRFAARLPSLVSLLVTQSCLFFATRRLARLQVTALVAMAAPFVLVTLDYAAEARVYGLLVGCFAVALLCWQAAAAMDSPHRTLAVFGLAAALGLAILTHFYGVFLAIPLWCAQVVRTLERLPARNAEHKLRPGIVDLPVFLALLFGTGALLFDIPYVHALAPFRQHYYNTGETAWSSICFTYFWFWDHFLIYHRLGYHLYCAEALATLIVFALILFSGARIRAQWRTPRSSAAFEVALSTAAMIPVFNLVAAQFIKAYVPRYSLPAVVGIAILFALALDQFRVPGPVQWILLAAGIYLGVTYSHREIARLQQMNDGELSILYLTQAQQAALLALPDHHIYVQNVARFMFLHYYAPPTLNRSLAGLYSIPCDLRWTGRDPATLFARNMQHTADVPFMPFAQLQSIPGPYVLAVYHDPFEEWIGQEIAFEHLTPTPLGPALGADLEQLTFDPTHSCQAEPAP